MQWNFRYRNRYPQFRFPFQNVWHVFEMFEDPNATCQQETSSNPSH